MQPTVGFQIEELTAEVDEVDVRKIEMLQRVNDVMDQTIQKLQENATTKVSVPNLVALDCCCMEFRNL